jgi:hypothetical protein
MSENQYITVKEALKVFVKELGKNEKYKLINPKNTDINDYTSNIYNEYSLQHELGLFLKNNLSGNWKIFFEKSMYNNKKIESKHQKDVWVKKEADLVVIKYAENNEIEKYAIELKFCRGINARTPENMFDFIKDIRFMEQVKYHKKFTNTYNLIIVDNRKYYDKEYYKRKKYSYIYDIFKVNDNGKINIPKKPKNMQAYSCPTNNKTKKDINFTLLNSYHNKYWKKISDLKELKNYRYLLIEINK